MSNNDKLPLTDLEVEALVERISKKVEDSLNDKLAIFVGNSVLRGIVKIIGLASLAILYYLHNTGLIKW